MTFDRRRALVVEDEPLMASLLGEALSAAGFDVDHADTVAAARAAVARFDPDVALLDISLGRGPTGIDLARILRATRPDIALLILTKHPDARTAGGEAVAVPEGCGFLRKELVGGTAQLLASIELVLADNAVRIRQDRDPARPFAALTTRQVAVLRLVAQGYTNAEIAARREISASAVEHMLGAIFRRLGIDAIEGVNPRAEAMRIFIANAGLPARE